MLVRTEAFSCNFSSKHAKIKKLYCSRMIPLYSASHVVRKFVIFPLSYFHGSCLKYMRILPKSELNSYLNPLWIIEHTDGLRYALSNLIVQFSIKVAYRWFVLF